MTRPKQSRSVSRLRCATCGLGYSLAALAREMTLTAGAACRRCGGTLEADDARCDPVEHVVAVRSPITGTERLPYG
jgi:DNA-directed RNA polymerase subunit RPC12/RpoP